ncbi:MAG: transporter substrate-binding domain-containing protein [Desulfobacteraceae bacterium]|nr:transporter substrate-binding domain-containing protein [Desulfobacteraceae bacterium]
MVSKTISSLTLAIFILLSNLFVCNAEDSKHINICYDHWVPSTIFLSKENTKKGFVSEMLADIYTKAGYDITFHEYPYSRCLSEVSKGNCDIIAEANPETKEAAPGVSINLLFPKRATFKYRYALFIHKDKTWEYNGINSLKGMRIGNIPGYDYSPISTVFEDYLVKNKSNSALVYYAFGNDGATQLLDLIAKKRIDLFSESFLIGAYIIKQNFWGDKIKIAGFFKTPLVLKPGFSPKRKDVHKLMDIWDQGRKSIESRGEIKKYLKKYGISVDKSTGAVLRE